MLIILLMMLWTVMTILFGVNVYELTEASKYFPIQTLLLYSMWIMNFFVGVYFAKHIQQGVKK